ncbi:hypothetical protein C8R46DRAFT_1362308 [Mycena filopes]|nr:hypothetical protein C8R46DRAFT_1362308 [Mycena filopes]
MAFRVLPSPFPHARSFRYPGVMLISALLLTLFASGAIAKNNDWTKACTNGECFYDLPASSGVSGTVRVWGATEAISDITAAAGWTVLDCHPTALAQNIRLVCTGADADCNHLFQGGALHTLVRLPEDCGGSAFARVSRHWVHADQTLPAVVAKAVSRRAIQPLVQGLAVDTSFADVDPVNGNVSIALSGTNVPGQVSNLTVTPPPAVPARRSRLQDRGFFDFIENAFKKFNNFDDNITKSLPAINVDKTFPVFSQSISCPKPAISASVSVGVEAKAHAVVSVGMTAIGTIIPPHLSAFGAFAGLDATVSGTMTLKGSASGTIDSGVIDVYSVGMQGLNFPGLLSLGPTFKIGVRGTAELDVQADATMVLAYNVQGAKLFFPKSSALKSGGGFTPGNSPLTLSVQPGISGKGVLSAHLIPRVELGISGLGASSTVALILDASASMTLTLDAHATAGVSTTGPSTGSGTVNGCVDVGAGLDVSAEASANFFGLFDKSTKVDIFNKDFELFKTCIGKGVSRRSARAIETKLTRRANLGCPAAIAKLVSAVNAPVNANSITTI